MMNRLALIAGGFTGTLLRYGASGLMPFEPAAAPLSIALINLIGCFLLGWLFTITTTRWNMHPEWRLGLGTGLIGSFTTFSTFSVQTVELLRNGHAALALGYVLTSVVGGLAMTYGGIRLAARSRREAEG